MSPGRTQTAPTNSTKYIRQTQWFRHRHAREHFLHAFDCKLHLHDRIFGEDGQGGSISGFKFEVRLTFLYFKHNKLMLQKNFRNVEIKSKL